jgi:hypothetical protein
VDYHSFFYTHNPDSFTQLGAALRFYGVALRYAPNPIPLPPHPAQPSSVACDPTATSFTSTRPQTQRPNRSFCSTARSSDTPSGFDRTGLSGFDRTQNSGFECYTTYSKNRLASAAGKQDDSGVHYATAANGNQNISVAAALLARLQAKKETVSGQVKLGTNPYPP